MNNDAAPRRIVAVGLKTWAGYTNEVVEGILGLARKHSAIEVRDVLWSEPRHVFQILCRMRPAGAILGMTQSEFATIRHELPKWLPLVNVGADTLGANVATVCSNDASMVRLALDHLRKAGYDAPAYVDWVESSGSARRLKLLQRRYRAAPVFHMNISGTGDECDSETIAALATWLRRLAPRTGLLVYNGAIAREVLRACVRAERLVPADLGIIAFGDGQACTFAEPKVTALEVDGETIGRRALAILMSMLDGVPAPNAPEMVPALGVIARTSTVGTVTGWDIESALRYIELNACKGITIDSAIAAIPGLGRTRFYAEFTARTGCTPAAYLRRFKLERARQLLSDSLISIERIAGMCGYNSAAQFAEAFKREVGIAPLKFRRQGKVALPKPKARPRRRRRSS